MTSRRLVLRTAAGASFAALALPALAPAAFAAAGAVTLYSTPIPYAGPHGITSGPDGSVWFTEQNIGMVAKITPDGATITEFPTT